MADDFWLHQSYLIIYCMEPGPSRESDSSSANQKIPHTLWNTKFYQHILNIPPPVPLLNNRNPFSVLFPLPKIPSQYHSLIYARVFQKLFPSGFPTNEIHAFLPPPSTPHCMQNVLLYSCFLIWSTESYLAIYTDH